jgi:hypothetical protein
MMHVLSFRAFSLFTLASAQVTSTSKFTNPWLSEYVVGLTYQISWTAGDDLPVSLTISNSTFSQDLACKFDVFEQGMTVTDTRLLSFPSSTDNNLVQLDRALFAELPKHLRSIAEPERT